MNEATTTETKRYHCRHIFTDGHRCGSPALRAEPFCYYHHTTRKPAPRQPQGRKSAFDLPLPEDRSAIQLAIGTILQRIASNDLDSRRAGLLLYGLQIASLNLPKQKEAEESAPIEEITNHPELGTLAPETEIKEKKSFAAQLLEQLSQKPAQPTDRDLQQPPFGEITDKAVVGGEEVVGSKGGEWRPLDVVEDTVVQVAVELIHDEELQVDGSAVAVLMADAGDAAANGGGDAKLLVKLADEGLFVGLASLNLAPRELPLQAHGLVGTALADQHLGLTISG
jgi:hypothetical protein